MCVSQGSGGIHIRVLLRKHDCFHLIDWETDSEKATGIGLIGFQKKIIIQMKFGKLEIRRMNGKELSKMEKTETQDCRGEG